MTFSEFDHPLHPTAHPVLTPMSATPTPQEMDRFWSKVDKTDPGGCWLWTGTTVKHRGIRPIFRVGGRWFSARQISWSLAHSSEEVQTRRVLVPTCGHPLCVNPAHLAPQLPPSLRAKLREDPTWVKRSSRPKRPYRKHLSTPRFEDQNQFQSDLDPSLRSGSFRLAGQSSHDEDISAFLRLVDDRGGPEACWHWEGSDAKSAPMFRRLGTGYSARRIMWALCHSSPLSAICGFKLTCGCQSCLNPRHLRPIRRSYQTVSHHQPQKSKNFQMDDDNWPDFEGSSEGLLDFFRWQRKEYFSDVTVKSCEFCDAHFEVDTLSKRRFCSKKCCMSSGHGARGHRASGYLRVPKEPKRKHKRICEGCGKPFLSYKKRRFCGLPCFYDWQRRTQALLDQARPNGICKHSDVVPLHLVPA